MPLTDLSFLVLHRDGMLLDDLLADLANEQPEWRIGAALRLPRHSLAYCLDRLDSWESDADYVLADPETRLMILPYRNRGRGRDDHAYLQESDPAANRKRFVDRVLRAQAAAGRDLLISPSLIHGLTPTKHQLHATLDFARRSLEHPLARDRQVLVGLEATDAIFADKTSRDAMLDEVVELEGAPPVYLRMTTSAALGGRKQYENVPALRGLRAAVEALVANDHAVLQPQSGLAGWLMLGFGAHCFGAGIPATLQRCPRPAAGVGAVSPRFSGTSITSCLGSYGQKSSTTLTAWTARRPATARTARTRHPRPAPRSTAGPLTSTSCGGASRSPTRLGRRLIAQMPSGGA